MKKQINPTIKAHLIRRAFYVLLFLAVCAIPFALARSRGGESKRSLVTRGTCPNPWEEVAPMPIDLAAAACASDGTFVYCGGGNSLSQGTTLAVFNRYDPVMDTWTDLTGTTPFPHPAGGFAYGVINGKLYIAGGRDYADVVLNLNWEYDPAANVYIARADEPAQYGNNVPGSGVALNAIWV